MTTPLQNFQLPPPPPLTISCLERVWEAYLTGVFPGQLEILSPRSRLQVFVNKMDKYLCRQTRIFLISPKIKFSLFKASFKAGREASRIYKLSKICKLTQQHCFSIVHQWRPFLWIFAIDIQPQ